MNRTRCKNGHFYDSDKDNRCPFCDGWAQAVGKTVMPGGRILKGGAELNAYKEWQGKNKYFGKNFSVLGDSISTLSGYNPKGYDVFYDDNNCKKAEIESSKDTWWGSLIDFFGGELLVNNSYSGSRVSGRLASAGNSDERTSGLHLGEVQPDVIIVYLGTNDYDYGVKPHFYGTVLLGDEHEDLKLFDYAYKTMLYKIRNNYPNAEIWCIPLYNSRIKGSDKPEFSEGPHGYSLHQYNAEIDKAVRDTANCFVIDFSRPTCDPLAYESFDGSHPTKKGMAQLACMFIREIDANAGNTFLNCTENKHQFVFNGTERVYYNDDEGMMREIHYSPVCEHCAAGNSGLSKTPQEWAGCKKESNEKTYIRSLKNNIKIYIEKNEFKIGRDQDWADFAVAGNKYIARCQAIIINSDNRYFLCDLGSANGTYINGIRLQPNQKTELLSESKLRFADDEFVFYCRGYHY